MKVKAVEQRQRIAVQRGLVQTKTLVARIISTTLFLANNILNIHRQTQKRRKQLIKSLRAESRGERTDEEGTWEE